MIKIEGGWLTIGKLAEITGGKYTGKRRDEIIKNISTDTRDICGDTLFIAIKGEKYDGHDFMDDAVIKGASCVLADHILSEAQSEYTVLAENTLTAFGAVATYHKKRIDPLTAAVTGSVGKTTTKEFIYSVFSERYVTLKTEGNFNNEVGLPKTMLLLEQRHEAAVFELGMSGKGEIGRLSLCAEPDIAVITNIGTAHIEYLKTKENIRDAKMEITKGLKQGGTLILNGDDPLLKGAENGVCAANVVYAASRNTRAQYKVNNIRRDGGNMIFDINGVSGIRIPVIGEHNVLDAAYAYAAGKAARMTDDEIKRGLLNFRNTGMRQRIYETCDYTVIEDCYNASPESMTAALKLLGSYKNNGRKIAVLGDMRELGEMSAGLHREIGKAAAQNNIGALFTFGKAASEIGAGYTSESICSGELYSFENLSDVKTIGEALKNYIKAGDAVLFKASRAVELERVIKYLKGE